LPIFFRNPASYDDPKPADVNSFDSYLTSAAQPGNATGPAGALPMQVPDPTAGNSATSGLSIELQQQRFNFVAPVLNLAGRAGMNVSLA
jgi:hypothetical protein